MRSSKSPRRSAPARSNSSRRNGCPASKAVFVKNADYVPRKRAAEPGRRRQGGQGRSRRMALHPRRATAAGALKAGEADWYEQPPADSLPVFAANKDVKVDIVDPLGNIGFLRFNHPLPPFNNPKMREAVLNLVNQKDYMPAVAGDEKYWKTCSDDLCLRRPAGDDRRRRRAAARSQCREGQGADQGGRLQRREDRAAVGDRPADRPGPGAGHASKC